MAFPAQARHLLPRGPVLDWSSFSRPRLTDLPAIDQAPQQLLVTSGRAALALALRALQLPPGSTVLVPSYHCPTMIAPVVWAGLRPVFYALGDDALPRLDTLGGPQATAARAIIVAHLFGLPRSLAAVRRWCDAHGVALIEDCAHSFFGRAGERCVGAWGDFATASLTKFFPVPEAGLLVSNGRALPRQTLTGQGWKAEFKGGVDLLEIATQSGRLRGLRPALRSAFWVKNRRTAKQATVPVEPLHAEPEADALQGCDMARVNMSPLAVSRWAWARVSRARIASRRHDNFLQLKTMLANAAGTRMVCGDAPSADAPYALPLWVDDADRVYSSLRSAGMPVFRWDRPWTGTPVMADDAGPGWSRHVLQLLCHQDLCSADIALLASTVRRLL